MNLSEKYLTILELPQFNNSTKKIDNHSYKEFKLISKFIQFKILNLLKSNNKKEDFKIIILLKTGIEAYAAMVACLDLKICYVPLNVENSKLYNSEIISIVNPDLIITSEKYIIDEFKNISFIFNKNNIEEVNQLIQPIKKEKKDNLAYIIFTSGTTGKPKGVMVSRSNLFSYLNYCCMQLPFSHNLNVLQTAAISFDLSVLSIFPPLIKGTNLTTLQSHKNELLPWKIIQDEKINLIISVPSFLSLIFSSSNLNQKYFSKSTNFIFCGEPLNKFLVSNIFKNLPQCKIFNLYGPTEVTVSCTALKLDANNFESNTDGINVSIGVPINDHFFILKKYTDEDNQIKNTLLIKGPQVAKGYLNNINLTKSKFIKVMKEYDTYDTGDNVYLRKDGKYFFKNRNDRQIKISGYRIELGEIESRFLELGADEALAIAKNRLIKVYYSTRINLKNAEIEKSIKGKLPHYYRLKLIKLNNNLKRTKNGKVDIKYYELINEMNEKDKNIFEIISKYTDLDITKINQNTSTENTPEWDSLAHMQILNDLSRIYNFELKPENIINLNSFLSIRDYLLKFEK